MKKRILLFASLITLFYSCTPSRESQISNIKALDEKVQASFTTNFDVESATQLLDAYAEYFEDFDKDSLREEFMFNAGKLASSMNKHKEAIEFFEKFNVEFPSSLNRPESVFLLANVYENQVFMLDKAEALYNEYLEKYPDGVLADLAKFALKNLGKTPEELQEELTKDTTAKDSAVL